MIDWKAMLSERMEQDFFIEHFNEIVDFFERPKMSSYDEYLHLMYNHYAANSELKKFVNLELNPWLRVGSRSDEVEALIKLNDKEPLFGLLV